MCDVPTSLNTAHITCYKILDGTTYTHTRRLWILTSVVGAILVDHKTKGCTCNHTLYGFADDHCNHSVAQQSRACMKVLSPVREKTQMTMTQL